MAACAVGRAALGTIVPPPGRWPVVVNCVHLEAGCRAVVNKRHGALCTQQPIPLNSSFQVQRLKGMWTCGSKCGVHQWVPLEVDGIYGWPTRGLKSRSKFKSCAARPTALSDRERVRGKSDVGRIPLPGVLNPASVGIVPTSEVEDSATSFQGPWGLSEQQCVQPMRQAKLLRIPIVDSEGDYIIHSSN